MDGVVSGRPTTGRGQQATEVARGQRSATSDPPPAAAVEGTATDHFGRHAALENTAAVGNPSPVLDLHARARAVRLVLTDSDGVLTDNGVYYSARGEEMKRFSIRDGMGVERLRKLAGVEVGIITGEISGAVEQRAAKLQISELHLGIKDKANLLDQILARTGLEPREVAFIGDDTNDVEIMGRVGLAGCPADATPFARAAAHFVCPSQGGHGAFRDFAELIIAAKG
jgi:3-deoxy-D-manno-octulosonate 8-phosphate phosphatase (KDO 8-P phosphatase)